MSLPTLLPNYSSIVHVLQHGHLSAEWSQCSVVSNSLQPHGLSPARLLCPWNFPGKNTSVGCHFLLQGVFPTQGLNTPLLCLLPRQTGSLPLSHPGSIFIVTTLYVIWLNYIMKIKLNILKNSGIGYLGI